MADLEAIPASETRGCSVKKMALGEIYPNPEYAKKITIIEKGAEVPKHLWVSDRSDSETRRDATDVPKIKNRLGIPRTENEVVKVFLGDFRFPT